MNKYHTGAFIKGVTDEAERKIYAKISDEVLDRDGEIIRLSAWSQKQLDSLVSDKGGCPLLVGHDYRSLPIGKILRFDLKSDGLYMEAQLVKKTRASDEAWEIISQVGSMSFSVGFMSKDSKVMRVRDLEAREKASCLEAGLSESDTVNVHKEVEMLEVSLVSVPSLETTALISYRAGSIRTKQLRDEIEKEITLEPDKPKSKADSIEAAIERALSPEKIGKILMSKVNERLSELKGKLGDTGQVSKKDTGYTLIPEPKNEAERLIREIQHKLAYQAGSVDHERFIKRHFYPEKKDPELDKTIKEVTETLTQIVIRNRRKGIK